MVEQCYSSHTKISLFIDSAGAREIPGERRMQVNCNGLADKDGRNSVASATVPFHPGLRVLRADQQKIANPQGLSI